MRLTDPVRPEFPSVLRQRATAAGSLAVTFVTSIALALCATPVSARNGAAAFTAMGGIVVQTFGNIYRQLVAVDLLDGIGAWPTLIPGLLSADEEDENSADPSSGIAKSLKAFVSHPPTCEMIAEVCTRDRQSTNESFSCYYALIRYQTNGFYYREATGLHDLFTTNIFPQFAFAGYYDETYWYFAADGTTFVYGTNKLESLASSLTNIVAKASKAMNLGIFDSLPRSILWKGNLIRDLTNAAGVVLRGCLIVSNGLPAGIDLNAEIRGVPVPWQIIYNFESNSAIPQFLPTRISAFSLAKTRRLHNFDVRLVRVVLSDLPLPRESFLPGPTKELASHYVLQTPRGDFVSDKRLFTSFVPIHSEAVSGRARLIMYLFLAANVVVIAAFVFRSRHDAGNAKRTQQQLNEERKKT